MPAGSRLTDKQWTCSKSATQFKCFQSSEGILSDKWKSLGKGAPCKDAALENDPGVPPLLFFFNDVFLLIPYPIPAAHLISDSSLYYLKNINLIVDSKAITLRGNIRLPILQNKNNNKKSLIINLMRSASPFHFKIVVWPRYN